MSDIEALIKEQGEAFDAFKKSHDEQIAEIKKGVNDPVLGERIAKIEASLDKAAEAKAAAEAAIAAERKEREALEAKLNRMNLSGHSEESAKREIELKTFNTTLASVNAERRRRFDPLDHEGYGAYKSAIDHWLRGGEHSLSPEEIKILQVGSDPDGGYWVTPDMSGRIVRKVYETSPVRQNASGVTISTDSIEGVEDLDEAGVGYAGEHSLSGNADTPQIGKWRLDVYWYDTEPKVTQQLLDDAAVDVEAFLAGKVADKFARWENNEFINGASKIRGFVAGYTTATDSGSGVTWGQIGAMKTGVNGDFAASDPVFNLLDLVGLMKNAHLANAKFYTRRSVINKVRKWKDSTGNLIWQPSLTAGTPEQILGYPIVRMEDMPALASGSYSLAFGDLREAYTVVDRQGMRVIRDNLTSKPYVKFYTSKRSGGGILNYEAIKLLQFAA